MTIFVNEGRLKAYIEMRKRELRYYEHAEKNMRNRQMPIRKELCFLFDKYNELYNKG